VSLEKRLDVGVTQCGNVCSDLFVWPVPPLQPHQCSDYVLVETESDVTSRVTCDDGVWSDIAGNYGSSANNRAISNGHARQDERIASQPDVIANGNGPARSRMPIRKSTGHAELVPKRISRRPVNTVVAVQHDLDAVGDRTERPNIESRWVRAKHENGGDAVGIAPNRQQASRVKAGHCGEAIVLIIPSETNPESSECALRYRCALSQTPLGNCDQLLKLGLGQLHEANNDQNREHVKKHAARKRSMRETLSHV
jgi:hypothetical protein